MKINWDVSIRLKQIVIKIVTVEQDFDYKHYDRKYYNDYSSILNDGVGEVLYLLRIDPTSTKSTKSDSLYRCFYTYKKHKALNKQLSSS